MHWTAWKDIPEYIWNSFCVHVSKMKAMAGTTGIWLSKEEMKQYPSLRAAFEKMLAHFDLPNVNNVHQYEWHIKGD